MADVVKSATYATTTDSDGRFVVKLPDGDYLFLTEDRGVPTQFLKTIVSEHLMWVKRIKIEGKPQRLILDQKSASRGLDSVHDAAKALTP